MIIDYGCLYLGIGFSNLNMIRYYHWKHIFQWYSDSLRASFNR